MVVWTGVQIAMSGTFQPWQIIRLIIGLWIPWVMLHFYDTPLPPPAGAYTFPSMIVEGGNWLMDMFLGDILTAVKTELSNMVNVQLTRIADAWEGFAILDLIRAGSSALATLIMGTVMMSFTMAMLILLYCLTYAQVLWAQLAIAILVFLGPLFIPWLLFEPLSFLFWGWFRSLLVFSLYGALAGAVLRVFMGVTLGYITSFFQPDLQLRSVVTGRMAAGYPALVRGRHSGSHQGRRAGFHVSDRQRRHQLRSHRHGDDGGKRRRSRRCSGRSGRRQRCKSRQSFSSGSLDYEQRQRRNRKDLRRDMGRGDPLQPTLARPVDGFGRTLPPAGGDRNPAFLRLKPRARSSFAWTR